MVDSVSKRSALIALGLLVGAANLGIAARLYLPQTVGQALFVATRFWILGLPLLWFFRVERRRLVLAWPTWSELWQGLGLGGLMFVVIGVAYWYIGRPWMDVSAIRSTAATLGLDNRGIFLAFAVYFTVINALVEEYIWRWFVCRQCEVFLTGFWAIGLAALCFTLHHVIALQAYVGNVLITILGSLGVLSAGLIWSVCYMRSRSLWICCISHMMADLAIAIAAGQILFGDI